MDTVSQKTLIEIIGDPAKHHGFDTLKKYDDYYNNKAFEHIEQAYPEYRLMSRKRDYKKSVIPVNWARFFVDRQSSWLFENGVDFSVTTEGRDDANAQERETLLYDTYSRLDLEMAAREANKTGGVAIKALWTPDKQVKLIPRPRIETFVTTDPNDADIITAIDFAFVMEDNKHIWLQKFWLDGTGKTPVAWMSETIYNEQKAVEEKIVEEQPITNGRGIFLKKTLDVLPVAIFPNIREIGDVWGRSELDDLIPLIDEYLKKKSDAADSLRFEMFAIKALINVKIDATGGLSVSPGAIWDITGGDKDHPSDVKSLEHNFTWREAYKDYMDDIKAAMYQLARVTPLTNEDVKGLGALSGTAIKLLFALQVSATKQKQKIYEQRLQQLNEVIFKYHELYGNAVIKGEYGSDIIFHTPIPQNDTEDLDNAIKRLQNKLSSVTAEMDRAGVEDPEALIVEILADEKMFADAADIYQSRLNDNGAA